MISIVRHHKHPALAKSSLGEWGRNEIAIHGAPCGVIRSFAMDVANHMRNTHAVCYVDAEHQDAEDSAEESPAFHMSYTDRTKSIRYEVLHIPSMFQRRAQLSGYDLILVNGNHFTASQQIVLLHSGKMESLQRKKDRLTDVVAVIEMDVSYASCTFLHDLVKPGTPVIPASDTQPILDWHRKHFPLPSVNGLVLAGGKSIRMGSDKTLLAYHGMPQREYVSQLLQSTGLPVFLSCRKEQITELQDKHILIEDRFDNLGPYGAILSAFQSAPDHAWLVVASDLPFLSAETIRELLRERDSSRVATAFHNPETGFPEPLITLWEPKSYPMLLSFLAQGNNCPRKALIQSQPHIVQPKDPHWLVNVNTPQEYAAVLGAQKR